MAFEKMKYIKSTPEECLFQTIDCLETEMILVSAIVTYDTQWIAAEIDDKLSFLSCQDVLKDVY